MGTVLRFCDRAMLLEHGRRVEVGDPERVGMRYLQLNFDADARAQEEAEASDAQAPSPDAAAQAEPDAAGEEVEEVEIRLGDGRAEILESWFEDEDGRRTTVLPSGRPCTFRTRVRFADRLEDPLFGVNFHNSNDDHVWGASNIYEEGSGVFEAGAEIVFAIAFANVLAPDRYFATPAVADAAGGLAWHDRRSRFASVMVTATRPRDGLLELPFEVAIERVAPALAIEQPERATAEETAR
jgi:hypothetical protein